MTRTPGRGAQTGAGRLRFLDVARALAVLAMLLANLVNVFPGDRPHWLAHNLGDELLPLDLPAPMFQFLIGVSLALFLARRRGETSAHAARWLATRRFLALVALGAVLDGIVAQRVELRWGVLQTLGAGGLLAVAVSEWPDLAILALAALIVATHYGPGNNEVHRSLSDCLPFLPITLVGYVVGRPLAARDVSRHERRAVAVALACLVLALVLRAVGIPFNKVTGSSSFVLFAIAASGTFIAALARMEARGWHFPDALARLGASALTAWVLLYVLVYYPIAIGIGHPLDLSEAAGLAVTVVCLAVLIVATLALDRRGIRVPL